MEVWESIHSELSKIYDSSLNSAILDKIRFKQISNNNTIELIAPDQLTAVWFNENFLSLAKTAGKNILGKDYKFRVSVAPSEKSYQKNEVQQTVVANLNPYSVKLVPKYTFDNFVVGSSNDFAYAAAKNVAQFPGQSYNPLFIYGNVALGKTHLLQAIAHDVLKNKKGLKVMYLTSEKFTNEFVESLMKKDTLQFRRKFRNIDVLIIDDIQFFQNKGSTLEEVFHTFNKLLQDRKQMIFACDRPPKSLSAIEDRLRTRFDSGLTVEIKSPNFETRKAILKMRAKIEGAKIPDKVFDYIAQHIEEDVRMMEGSLIKIIAYSNLKKKEVSMELTKEILRDKIKVEMPKGITVTDIQKKVSSYFGIKLTDIKSTKRQETIAYPRQIAMFLAKEYTKLSLSEIGHLFGGKAHTTVMRSSQKISDLVKRRKKVKREVDDIISTFYDKK